MRAPCRSRASRAGPAAARPDLKAVDAAAPTLAASPASRGAPPIEPADPELLKLFIEEAQEELAKIQAGFPVWDQNPLEHNALVTVRRSFHTLKGSGRMVGARELGEFAWSIENLLNRLLDNTLTRSAAILETLREAVRALPELVAQLATGAEVRADVHGIAARAHALAASRPAPPVRSAEAAEEDGVDPLAAPPSSRPAPACQAAPAAATSAPEAPAARAAASPMPAAPATARRCRARRRRAQGGTGGRHAARHLRPRDGRPRGDGAGVSGTRTAAARAARPARGGLPRLPHALGQLEDGAGAPRHPPRRAARSLAAPRLRQQRGTFQ